MNDVTNAKEFELEKEFGRTENFYPKDTTNTPHPYCITSRHVGHASDNFSGILGEAAIKSAEKAGARCGVRGCNLSYEEHEKVLLIYCKEDAKEKPYGDELRNYLVGIEPQLTKQHYAGVALIDGFSNAK